MNMSIERPTYKIVLCGLLAILVHVPFLLQSSQPSSSPLALPLQDVKPSSASLSFQVKLMRPQTPTLEQPSSLLKKIVLNFNRSDDQWVAQAKPQKVQPQQPLITYRDLKATDQLVKMTVSQQIWELPQIESKPEVQPKRITTDQPLQKLTISSKWDDFQVENFEEKVEATLTGSAAQTWRELW